MYKQDAVTIRDTDCEEMLQCASMEELARKVWGTGLSQATTETAITQYLDSQVFNSGADYFGPAGYRTALARVISRVFQKAAAEFGFPHAPQTPVQASRIDTGLSGALIEALEDNEFIVPPYEAGNRMTQAFMTQRVFPLISFWRWKIITGKPLSKDRIISSPRNYFYTLWLSGWLFDTGADQNGARWELLHQMSADSLVQIIERSGIGFRKGFAQAIAMERRERGKNSSATALDKLVRGCMKRATFTFSTAVMPEDENYYRDICQYLFDWAEKNYLPQQDEETE